MKLQSINRSIPLKNIPSETICEDSIPANQHSTTIGSFRKLRLLHKTQQRTNRIKILIKFQEHKT